MKKYIAINATALFKKNKTGVEWYTWQLLRSLSSIWKEKDPTVVLFAPQSITCSTKRIASIRRIFLQKSNWKIKILPGRFFWTQWHLWRFLTKNPPTLLFSPSYLSPIFLSARIPTLNVIHGLEGEYFPEVKNFREMLLEDFFGNLIIRKSTRLIAVSPHTREDLNYFFNIPFEKISMVPSGPGTITNLSSINKKYPLCFQKENDTVNFFFLGGEAERKNLELAIKIFSLIQEKIQLKCRLWLGGQIKKSSFSVHQLLEKNSGILKLGYLSEKEKQEYFSQSHFLLYPSFYEGFGFPALEAQAFGAIPIVLKGNGVREITGDSIVEINPEAEKSEWLEKIIQLIRSVDKFTAFQIAGRNNVKKYNWQKCAKQIKTVILETINQK